MAELLKTSLNAYEKSKNNDIDFRSHLAMETEKSLSSDVLLSEVSHTNEHRSRSTPEITNVSIPSSTHLDFVNNARRPSHPISNSSLRFGPHTGGGTLPESVEAKMKAFHLSRQGTPTRPLMPFSSATGSNLSNIPGFRGSEITGLPVSSRLPANQRPQPPSSISTPIIPKLPLKGGLSARRGMKLPGGLPGTMDNLSPTSKPPKPGSHQTQEQPISSMFSKFSEYVDTKNGTLKFAGKAVIHGNGIEFSSGNSFNISLDEVDTLEELGKGNYGTVYKVRHARPKIRRPGMGLAGCRLPSQSAVVPPAEKNGLSPDSSPRSSNNSVTGVVMAMKEIRLELDEAKFTAIIMELDILHRCNSPYIIDFYGAFFQEGAVYMCIEFMDGGSIDKIYGNGIPENILRKITFATVLGLKSLKEEHNIIHRDVKPTNILVNTQGQVKICDFGVSGNLVASIAKTNIGCQSYMAPERIAGGGMAQSGSGGGTYSVQSDIWSLGLTIIESALGRYPYPPETYNNIFSQLSAIVDGEPPALPNDSFSPQARDFVRGCLNKKPMLRPTYSMLLQHAWLAQLYKPKTISEEDENSEEASGIESCTVNGSVIGDVEVAEWVVKSLNRKKNGTLTNDPKPALHTAPLSTVSSDEVLSTV